MLFYQIDSVPYTLRKKKKKNKKLQSWRHGLKAFKFTLLQDMDVDGSKWEVGKATVPSVLFIQMENDPGCPYKKIPHNKTTDNCNIASYMTSCMKGKKYTTSNADDHIHKSKRKVYQKPTTSKSLPQIKLCMFSIRAHTEPCRKHLPFLAKSSP